jgi:hypothetical protein
MFMRAAIFLLFAIFPGLAFAGESQLAGRPPDFVPLGVYLSWERAAACAARSGVGLWDEVGKRLDALRANHVDLLWVTNMSTANLPRLAAECEKRKIRLLPCMDSVEAKIEWRWNPSLRHYEKVLPGLAKIAKNSKSLVGWVLSDEPLEKDFAHLDTLRRRFCELDPDRFSTAVFMWPQARLAPAQIAMPVFCVDLYPFFGPNDPNGPHTDDASKGFFRENARAMFEAIGDRPMAGWIMGMCFSEIWGPRKYDKKGHLIALPGSYLHWRAPTLAEMRWQVWESFRGGAKGFICYTLIPETPDPKTASEASPDVTWKEVLLKKAIDPGPNALTTPEGAPTPQLEELGRVYALLAPHTEIIRRWRVQSPSSLTGEGNCRLQTFVDSVDQGLYAIVVNDNLHEAQTLTLQLGKNITALVDITRNSAIPISGDRTAAIRLESGDGAVVRLKTKLSRP